MVFGAKVAIDPDVLLDRTQAAVALTSHGYRISAATLATLASRGGGPEFERYGASTLYKWGETLNWAKNRSRKHKGRPAVSAAGAAA
jgi:hypothetical protein